MTDFFICVKPLDSAVATNKSDEKDATALPIPLFATFKNALPKSKKNYIKFRKYLLSEGFIMMQESVYSKIVMNSQQSSLLLDRLRKNAPKKGLIQVLTITERQYSQIEYIIGENKSDIINTEDRLVVL